MKELYVSPEIELIRFTPSQKLANNDLISGLFPDSENPASVDPEFDFKLPL